MSIARPNPNITSRPLVLSFNYQMSASQGNCSFQSHARGLGKETLKGLWHRVSISMLDWVFRSAQCLSLWSYIWDIFITPLSVVWLNAEYSFLN